MPEPVQSVLQLGVRDGLGFDPDPVGITLTRLHAPVDERLSDVEWLGVRSACRA
jgi:hypothetical protein